MKPGTREAIQELLTAMERVKQKVVTEEEKAVVDEFMFCFRNCYTKVEIERHITNKCPPLRSEHVRILFQTFIVGISEESRQVYFREAEECEDLRLSQLRDDSAEARMNQGEASTSHTCGPNCKHPN